MATEVAGNAIREALKPILAFTSLSSFAKLPDDFIVTKGSPMAARQLTAGDLRRARTAYDAIGSGVKAAAITAAMVDAFYEVTEVTREGSIRNIKEGLAAALSTHTAAGAGPVGEAVAWEDFVALRIKALEEGARSAKKDFAIEELAFVLKFAPRHAARPVWEPGEVERLTRERDEAQARALASQTNSELLQSELADAIRRGEDQWAGWVQEQVARKAAVVRAETAESQLTTAEAALAESEQNAQGLASDLAGTQAELAETRKRLEKVADGNRPLPYGRDELGRFVRDAWIRWAQTQPNPKPSWLLAYDELPEPDKEADRQIGETIARWTLIGDAARTALTGDAQEAGK